MGATVGVDGTSACDDDAAVGGDGNVEPAPRLVGEHEGAVERPVGVEHLDAATVGHDDAAVKGRDGDTGHPVKPLWEGPVRPKGIVPRPVGVEHVDAIVSAHIGHDDAAVGGDGDVGVGVRSVVVAIPLAGKAPVEYKSACGVGIEHVDAIVGVGHDDAAVKGRDGDINDASAPITARRAEQVRSTELEGECCVGVEYRNVWRSSCDNHVRLRPIRHGRCVARHGICPTAYCLGECGQPYSEAQQQGGT